VILNLSYEEYFTQPIEEVWRALTDPVMLAAWLMDNDFEPTIGRRFVMSCAGTAEWNGKVEAVVLELDPPYRMVWSWSDGLGGPTPSRVTFELKREGLGTRLFVRHTGPSDDEQGRRVGGGWPTKLETLKATLNSTRH
jgi:uncharacterized protein YndB with AHSA1/START domain